MALTQTQVSQLYVSVFGRASEGEGNTYWQTDQPDMVTTANVMLDTDAAKDYFGTTLDDDQAFIEHIYLNTLGKTYAEDTEGVDYWVSELAGGKSKGEVITALINAAQATENAGDAQDQFNNKVAVSNYAADTLSAFTTIEEFTAFIDDVDETTASVTAAQVEVDAAAPNAGETFSLTEHVQVTSGTDQDDIFNAPTLFASAVGQVPTFQSGDTVNGKGGDDTLNATLFGGGTISATVSSVETIKVTDLTAGMTVNFANVIGTDAVTFDSSVGSSTISNVGNMLDLSVKNMQGNTISETVTYIDAAIQGTDNQSIAMNNANMDTLTLTAISNTPGVGLETLTFNATGSGSSFNDIVGSAVDTETTSVVVTGDVNIGLGSLTQVGLNALTGLETFDASTATGNVTAQMALANDMTITTGTGDDTIVIRNTDIIDDKDKIDLGDGTDTLVTTGNVGAVALDIANVESLTVRTNGANTVNATNVGSGVSKIDAINTSNGDSLIISGLADASTLSATGVKAGANTMLAFTAAGLNTTGTSDTVNFTINAQDASANIAANTTSMTVTTLTTTGYENVNIASTAVDANGLAVANAVNEITNLVDTQQKTVTITGDTNLKLSSGAAITAKTIDATDMTGGLEVLIAGSGTSDGKQIVTGGSGDDTISINSAALDKDQTIDGADGSDTLVFSDTGAINFAGATNAVKLSGISNFEAIGITNAANTTLTIDDSTLNQFTNSDLTVKATGAAAFFAALDADAVLSSNSAVTFDTSKLTNAAATTTFNIGNAKDTFIQSSTVGIADTVVIANAAYLQSTDVLTGGLGADVLSFDTAAGAGVDQTVTSAQMVGVTGYETIQILDAETAANKFTITLDNATIANNVSLTTSVLTIGSVGNVNDTVKVDASAGTGAYSIAWAGGGSVGATVITGAGDDTFAATGGAANDTFTTGGGKDDIIIGTTEAAQGTDTVTDMDLGAKTGTGANVDQFDFSGNTDAAGLVGLIGDSNGTSAAIAAGTNIIILNDIAYDTEAAVDTALAGTASTVAGPGVVIWQNSLGQVNVGTDDVITADGAGAGIDTLITLTGVTIASVTANLDTGDFIF